MEVSHMEQQQQIKFNDLTRDFIEDYITKLPKEDKKKLKKYIEEHPRDTSSSMFCMVKSYIYNTYFRAKPAQDTKNRGSTFADTITFLLMDDEDEE